MNPEEVRALAQTPVAYECPLGAPRAVRDVDRGRDVDRDYMPRHE